MHPTYLEPNAQRQREYGSLEWGGYVLSGHEVEARDGKCYTNEAAPYAVRELPKENVLKLLQSNPLVNAGGWGGVRCASV